MTRKLIAMKKRAAQVALVAGATVATSAQAALPAGATSAFTTLETDGGALIDAAWPVVTALTIGFVLIKLFKRAAGKI